MDNSVGLSIYNLAGKLFPICRSLTGDGVRQTLNIMREEFTGSPCGSTPSSPHGSTSISPCGSTLNVFEVPSGSSAFDWTVPKEWVIRNAYIKDLDGRTVLSFQDNNLHVVGYSAPFNKIIGIDDLKAMILTVPNKPDVIPYATSYYKEFSGFCMSFNEMCKLDKERYLAVIDSELKDGSLTYGEIKIIGESEKEIFFSANICHPSLGNNELSGPCLLLYLAKWVKSLPHRRYSYRFVFVPETIGSLIYMSRNIEAMKNNIEAGFVATCVGDDRVYSYLPSRKGNTLADRTAKNILSFIHPEYKSYSFLERGSDERQYCSPNIDLPVCSVMRSKYGEYPEYHTSADNMRLISAEGFAGSFEVYRKMIEALENNAVYRSLSYGEPQLGKRGLYPTLSYKGSAAGVRNMMNFLVYADGRNDLIAISDIIKVPAEELANIAEKLIDAGVVERLER